MELVRRAVEVDLRDGFRSDLAVVVSANKGLSGMQVHDEVEEEFELDCRPG